MYHTYDMYHMWTLYADLPADALRLKAAKAGALYPSVTAGAWSSVSGLSSDGQPPEWMLRLRARLVAEGIAHELD